MLDFIKNKSICTGCEACVSVCPTQCIKTELDEEGFYYPVISEDSCIKCGKCERVCPTYNNRVAEPRDKQFVVAAVSKSQSIWKKSTSGGAFTEICNAFGNSSTYVFGASWDNLRVVHKQVLGVCNIAPFRKSKYVESHIDNCFSDVKKLLDNQEKVIFSGTPCQIAGLKSFLNKDYNNLLLVDFICHGVGSPGVFDYSIKHMEKVFKKKIVGYSFRNRVGIFGNITDFNGKYIFSNGKSKLVYRDLFFRLFLSRLCIRPSCSDNCLFHHENRLSDITIADFRGKAELLPDVVDYRNFSTIIFNSSKAKDLYPSIKRRMKFFPIRKSDVSKYNSHYTQLREPNPRRNVFFQYFSVEKYRLSLFEEYTQVGNYGSQVSYRLRHLVPRNIKLFIKKILKQLK